MTSGGLLEGTDVDLEALLDQLAPCDWQSGHRRVGVECTGPAVALMWQDCSPDIRWRACASASAWVEWARSTTSRCLICDRPVRECWRTIPI